MLKRSPIALAVASVLVVPLSANAIQLSDSVEATVHLQNRTAAYTSGDQRIGQADTMLDADSGSAGEAQMAL